MTDREIEIVIKGKNLSGDAFKEVNKSLGGIGEAAVKTNSALDTAFGVLASTQLAAFGDAAGRLFSTMIAEAGEAQQTMVQLEQVIKSTGGAAGLTADDVAKLAEKWADLTVYEDDAIVAGQTLLLQFNNINKTNLDQATGAMVDLAARMGVDLPNAARILGRALEGQMAGLSRYGIIIDEQTQANIKALMDEGKTAEATALILDAIGKKVGGAAEAQAKTLKGLQDRISRDWLDFLETIGMSLAENKMVLGILDNLSKALQGLADSFSKLPEGAQVGIAGFVGLIAVLGKLALPLISLKVLLGGTGIGGAFSALGGTIGKIGATLGGLPALLVVVGAAIEAFLIDKLSRAGGKASEALAKVFGLKLPEEVRKYQETLAAKGIFSLDTWKAWLEGVKRILFDFGEFFSGIKLPEIKLPTLPKISTHPTGVPGRGEGAGAGLGNIIPAGVIDAAKSKLLELQATFSQVQASAMGFISGVAAAFANLPVIIGNAFTVLQTIVLNFFTGIQAQFANLPKIFEIAGKAFQYFGRLIESEIRRALYVLRDFVYNVQSWLSDLARRVFEYAGNIGTSIVDGIRTGIQNGWEALKTWISDNLTSLLEWVKTLLQGSSPSKLWANEVGLPIAQGIGVGIGAGMGDVRAALAAITAPNVSYNLPAMQPAYIPASIHAGARAPAGVGSYRVDVGRIEIHGSLSEGERRYFDKRAERISEKALLKVLK